MLTRGPSTDWVFVLALGSGDDTTDSAWQLLELRCDSSALTDEAASLEATEGRLDSCERMVDAAVDILKDVLSEEVRRRILAFDECGGTTGLSVASLGLGVAKLATSILS